MEDYLSGQSVRGKYSGKNIKTFSARVVGENPKVEDKNPKIEDKTIQIEDKNPKIEDKKFYFFLQTFPKHV